MNVSDLTVSHIGKRVTASNRDTTVTGTLYAISAEVERIPGAVLTFPGGSALIPGEKRISLGIGNADIPVAPGDTVEVLE